MVRHLVNEGAVLDRGDENKETPLVKAARWGHCNVIDYLVDKGAHVDGRNEYTPLIHALEARQVDAASTLVRRGADLKVRGPDGGSLLHYALNLRCVELFQKLVARGANVRSVDQQGRTPFELACNPEWDEIFELLFDGMVVSTQQLAHLAVEASRLKQFQLLRQLLQATTNDEIPFRNSDVSGYMYTITSPRRDNAAHQASSTLCTLIWKLLSETAGTKDLKSLLTGARSLGLSLSCHHEENKSVIAAVMSLATDAIDTELCFQMLEHSCDYELIVNDQDDTLLHFASKASSNPLLQKLLDGKARVDARNNRGDTALTFAALSGFLEGVKLLIEHGANINAIGTYSGLSPLLTACRYADRTGETNIMDLLLKAGADIMLGEGSPVHYALVHGSMETLRLLLQAGTTKPSASTLLARWVDYWIEISCPDLRTVGKAKLDILHEYGLLPASATGAGQEQHIMTAQKHGESPVMLRALNQNDSQQSRSGAEVADKCVFAANSGQS